MSQSTAQNTFRKFDGRISDNRALAGLLLWGGISAIAGLAITIISVLNSANIDSPASALAWVSIGLGLLGIGVLALIGGAVAHAINWQIKGSLAVHANITNQ
jgi:hypothetical protein